MPRTRTRTKKQPATLNVSLGRRYRKLTDDLVRCGRYGSASEVVRAAMRLLEAEEREFRETVEGVRRGLEDVAAGRVRPAGEVFARMRGEIEKRRA
jgi:antitoxin ParD1/3/4